MRAVLILFTLIFSIPVQNLPTGAQISSKDRETFREIIDAQIDAFHRNDAEKAFSYAVPALKEKFGTPERFMKIVRERYPAAFLPREHTFGEVTEGLGGPTQWVRVVGPHGFPWLALYTFQRKAQGEWKISGVTLRPLDPSKSQKAPPPDSASAESDVPVVEERLFAALAPKDGDVRFAASFNIRTREMVVIKVGEQEAGDKDFELWFIDGKKPPVSLGLLDSKDLKAPAVPAKLQSAFVAGATLAISVEPKGGSTTGAPTGPVIATGPIQKR